MELRKIQITGGSTHVISLPKKWVDRNGLQRSEALAIHEEADGSLLIVPHSEGRPRKRRIAIDLPDSNHEADLVRRLVGAYLAGADEILLRSNGRMEPLVRKVVRDTIRDLVGVEVLEEQIDSVTLQDLVGVSEMDLRKTVTRMHRIAMIMFDEAMQSFEHGTHDVAADVISRDDELDRLEWHVSKQMHALLDQPRLAARLDIRPAEALNLFLAARALERMGDHASKICKNLILIDSVPEEVSTSILAQAQVVRNIWDEAFNALKRDAFEQGSKATDDGKAAGTWRGDFGSLVRSMEPEAVGPLTLIADSVDRVRGYAVDIAEIAMNQHFQNAAVTS